MRSPQRINLQSTKSVMRRIAEETLLRNYLLHKRAVLLSPALESYIYISCCIIESFFSFFGVVTECRKKGSVTVSSCGDYDDVDACACIVFGNCCTVSS